MYVSQIVYLCCEFVLFLKEATTFGKTKQSAGEN